MPREQIASGKLVSTMLTLVRPIASVCGGECVSERKGLKEEDGRDLIWRATC